MSHVAKARPNRDSSFWAVALKIAIRELRASAVKFTFALPPVAAGVHGFGDAFHAPRRQARPDRDCSFWAVALKIAVRELRASGMGAPTGVGGFSNASHITRRKGCLR